MRENGKLCILRLSAIGDVCHAVALVERIQSQRPDIEITWIIGRVEHMLVGDIPGIRFIIFDKKQGRHAFSDLKKKLKSQTFDVLFLMQVALRANIASLCIKAEQRIGFDRARSKELHSLFINHRIASQVHPHVLDGFMAFADAIGIPKNDEVNWHIPIPEKSLAFAAEYQKQLGHYCVICPSASKAERNWTVEGYVQIAKYIKNKGSQVVLCGGPTDPERQLAEAITSRADVDVNLVGKTSLKDLLAVLKVATLVIAPDTGPAHMASTVRTNVIGLYAHSNPKRTGPYNNLESVVSVYDEAIQQQTGKKWQSLPWGVRAKGAQLMELITLEAVQKSVDKFL